MPITVAYILGSILALAATIVAFVMIVPEKKRATLTNKFWLYIHDLFNFKSLWLEKIIKFLYVFNTLACIGIGFFMLFSTVQTWGGTQWLGGYGLLVIIFGPIFVRIMYEFMMLVILAVKNLIDINNKLNPQPGSIADKKQKDIPAAPAAPAAPGGFRPAQPARPQQPAFQQPVQPRPAQPAQPQQPAQPRPGYTPPYTPPANNQQPPQYNNYQR